MQNFAYLKPATLDEAVEALARHADWDVLAGGTTMVDLMKLDVVQPAGLVDITGIDALQGHSSDGGVYRFGALASMAEVGDDAALAAAWPAMTESLWKAASPQLRNIARLGGNVLQRTRCPYFRETGYACNKREPGSGCAALDGGETNLHAIFGASDSCAAMYPGDWAQALIAFDAEVIAMSADGERRIPFAEFHTLPGDSPHVETVLRAGEILTAIEVPASPAMQGSTYLKSRDRESYAFATASAVAGIAMDGDGDGATVSDARIALGGVASVPWRAREAERVLIGQPFSEALAIEAGRVAFADAKPLPGLDYKIPLGRDVVAGALVTAHARATGA